MSARRLLIALIALLLVSPAAASASIETQTSDNWAGYAMHGTRFRTVTGTWAQPSATCQPGRSSYSSYWIGLGGYSDGSPALEQVGTETDCNAGRLQISAWYENVPQPSVPIAMTIVAGDRIAARVTVRGGREQIALEDLTSRQRFAVALRPQALDVTSAEWIVEAPADCLSQSGSCPVLPLADFGRAVFTGVRAVSARGARGGLGRWATTRLLMSRPRIAAVPARTAGGFRITAHPA